MDSFARLSGINTQSTPAEHAAGGPLESYLYVLSNKKTQVDYLIRLGYFFDYLQIQGDHTEDRAARFLERAQSDHKWASNSLTGFVSYLKNDNTRKLSGATIKNYFAAVKLFYEANTINLNWKWIAKGLPPSSHVANDRAPTTDELRKLVEYPDRRIRVIVYVMTSSGIRVGAWEYLKYKHITPIKDDKTGQVIAAKLKVYDGLPDPYFTFLSGEAYQAIQEYMDFRAAHGEKITTESWLLRDKFPTVTDKAGASRSLATNPKKLNVASIKRTLARALQAQSIRQHSLDLENNERRYEFKTAHGFRKYFKSKAEQVMRPINVEMLMNHETGVSGSYYKPTEQELLEDYLRAVDYLCVNRDQKIATQLQKQVAELTEKSEQENYIILEKLAKKEKEFEEMNKSQEEMEKKLDMMYEALQSMQVIKEVDEEQKKLLIESERYRHAAKAAQEQEEEMMKGALEEGVEMEEWGDRNNKNTDKKEKSEKCLYRPRSS